MSEEAGRQGRRCLVLGYDRSDSSRAAALWAAGQLQGGGKLVIVHSSRPLHAQPSPLSTAEERREYGRALIDELLMDDAEPLIDVEVQAELSERDPVSALIDAAERHGAEGIVLGHERHSPLHRALGTVSIELLNSSPVPVISVPAVAGTGPEQLTQSGDAA